VDNRARYMGSLPISTTSVDQFNNSQFPRLVLCSRIVRILLFQYEIHCHARFDQYYSATGRCHLHRIHHLSPRFAFRRRSVDIGVDVGCDLRSPSSHLYPPTKMGNGRILDDLHSRHPCLLIRAPSPRILEHG